MVTAVHPHSLFIPPAPPVCAVLPGKELLGKMTREEAADALNDPSWVKAVFFRDPVERLLSAYLVRLTPVPEGSLLCAKLPHYPH